MTRHALPLSLLLLTVLPLTACGNRNTAPDASSGAVAQTSAAQPAAAGAATPAPAAGGSAVAPISSHGAAIDPTPNSQRAAGAAGAIDFDIPAAWQKEPPSSDMRVAQAKIPGPGGIADFAVFYFGPGGGGPVDANIDRWVGQMEGAAKPKPEVFETNGYKVTWVDVAGTMKASQMGMGPKTAVANARLLGAVVEGPGGPWFFKAQGPDATLAPQRDAFVAMLKSVKKKG
ncbi:MAG TPA: hypothetical protein VGH73_02655 [Thermoanaerobaculia bacterium]|jgi:hypothetical protein